MGKVDLSTCSLSNCSAVTCSPVGVRPGIPDVGLKGVSGPTTGIDRPSSVSSAGARGASDEERGSSSSIICTFALSSLSNCFVFLTGPLTVTDP